MAQQVLLRGIIMNISVIGAGYVGLVTAACLADSGFNVICADCDREKIENLKKCIMPIYEPGLESIIKRCADKKLLKFTTETSEAVQFSDAVFICVGTPEMDDGSADISQILNVSREIAQNLNGYKLIINKSTVPAGTCRRIKAEVGNMLGRLDEESEFDIVSNPEFLREGRAVEDFIRPERIIIGVESARAEEMMRRIYHKQIQLGIPFISTGFETSEMIKYASNAFLASKISFINEIANMCERCGADIKIVSKAMGMDSRIGPEFLNPGPGFGGSCLPKDLKALVCMGKYLGYTPEMVKSTIKVNDRQKKLVLRKIRKAVRRLKNKTITVLGVSFKPETDDVRESPAVEVIKGLLKGGAAVKVYDPRALPKFKKEYHSLDIDYCTGKYMACINSDCIVIMTEWKEFTNIDFSILKAIVKTPVIIDMRNILDPEQARKAGFRYHGIGTGRT